MVLRLKARESRPPPGRPAGPWTDAARAVGPRLGWEDLVGRRGRAGCGGVAVVMVVSRGRFGRAAATEPVSGALSGD